MAKDMADEYGYNLVIKATTGDEAIAKVNEYLSATIVGTPAEIGYDEVIVSIKTTDDQSAALRAWHDESRPEAPDKYALGALVAWK